MAGIRRQTQRNGMGQRLAMRREEEGDVMIIKAI
jgi:hypothetical protein